MARINNLTLFLTDVADAIKTKKGSQDNIAARNFDTEILNLPTGGTDTSDATATINDILLNKTAYANGKKLTGTLTDISSETARAHASVSAITPSDVLNKLQVTMNEKATLSKASSAKVLVKNEASVTVDIDYDLLVSALGITADKIKEGETILGVIGTYQGEVDPDEYDKTNEVLTTVIGEYE